MCLPGKIYQLPFTDKEQSLSLLSPVRPLYLYLILALISLYYNDLILFLCLLVEQEGRDCDFFMFLIPRHITGAFK